MKLNEVYHLIIYCLNYIRRDQNSTYKTGLSLQLKLSYIYTGLLYHFSALDKVLDNARFKAVQ
jgi:hypothetical protein